MSKKALIRKIFIQNKDRSFEMIYFNTYIKVFRILQRHRVIIENFFRFI